MFMFVKAFSRVFLDALGVCLGGNKTKVRFTILFTYCP